MTNARCGRASMRPLASRIARFARERTVLVVSALAALATVPFVPPDEAYLGYFDVKTLACLFGILAVVGALRGIGLFEHAARLIVARFVTCRLAVAALVGSTLVLSMFATNDLALIMMLPLSAATLLKAGWERSLPFAFIMQNLAANLGGMILPFGNPQNLYLYERFSIPLGDFLSSMALPFAVSVVLIALCCVLFAKPEPPKATKKRASEKEAAENGISAYELMNREIEKSPVGANGLLYLPYILGERSPRWNTNARGAFVGLKMEHTRGDMLRATIEGILMNLCIILDVFRKDMDITELNVIGGLAKGDVVRRALADIYGVRAKRLNWLDEATSMGAAVCAGVGAGVLEDFGAIHRFIKVDDVLEPDMEHHKRYNELKQYFDECYTGLLKTYDNLAQWK